MNTKRVNWGLQLAWFLILIGLLLGVRRASGQVAVVSSTIEERVAAPGERYTGSILLRNSSNEPQEVKLYQTDYAFSANGQTSYAPAGTTARSSARWVELEPSQLVLPPRGEAVVTYAMAVPAATEITGSYWCIVMVETIRRGSGASNLQPGMPDRSRFGLHPTIRYGIQLVTHMPTSGSRSVELADAALLRMENGTRSLRFSVINTGRQAYRPKLTTELYDHTGKLSARFEKTRGLIYPGSSVQQAFELPRLPSGTYKILIIADTGAEQLFAAQYRLSF